MLQSVDVDNNAMMPLPATPQPHKRTHVLPRSNKIINRKCTRGIHLA